VRGDVAHERLEDEAAEALAAGVGARRHAPHAPAVTAPALPRRWFGEHRAHRHHVGVVWPTEGRRSTRLATTGLGVRGRSGPDGGVGADGVVVAGVLDMRSGLVRSQHGPTKGPHHLGIHELDDGGGLVHRWRR
jgi:hypothetical protein